MTANTKKTSWLLVAIKDDCLLLKKGFHEGRDILQLAGVPTREALEDLVSELFGVDYVSQMSDFGVIHNTIIKPGEIVEIHINLQRIVINGPINRPLDDRFEWCSKETCTSDIRCHRDVRLHSRLLQDQLVSLRFTEEQLHGWHNAQITSWEEDGI